MHVAAANPSAKGGRRRSKPRGMTLNIISLIDIFTVLVFFLLLNLTQAEVLPETKDVRLPESVAQTTARDTVVVMVSRDQILVQGKPVAKIKDVMASTDPLIPELHAALAALPVPAVAPGAAAAAVAEPPAGPAATTGGNADGTEVAAAPPRELTIMGDKETSYILLRKILATCADADFEAISLAVLQKQTPAPQQAQVSLAQ